jgi:hypothetical protein
VAEGQPVGVLLLALALGFGFITVLTAFFTERTRWWALIPTVVLVVVALGG